MTPTEVRIPSLGGVVDATVAAVLVRPGDEVEREDPLVTLESDKATIDLPSPAAGRIVEVRVKVGDKVGEGSVVVSIEASTATPTATPTPTATSSPAPSPPRTSLPHASPSVRRFARELGADLARIAGSGPRGRILADDVRLFVKGALTAGPASAQPAPASGLLPWPRVDFAAFGPVEIRPLSRIRRLSGAAVARNWALIPHVTQFEEADVTDLEAFRARLLEEEPEAKPTILAFVVKACAAALRRYPEFNASLEGDNLVVKKYVHVGFAADTPAGLVVPVLRDADAKGVLAIARELAALAAKARDGKLAPSDLQGGTFTVSSLGGIGGTAFTPIVNAPEVAILGVSRIARRPVWEGDRFVPRKVLPLSLSYDHRAIDGAAGARFAAHVAKLLADPRRLVL